MQRWDWCLDWIGNTAYYYLIDGGCWCNSNTRILTISKAHVTHTVISVSFIFNTLLHRDTAHTGHRCQIKQNEKIVRKFHEQTNERMNALSVFVNLEQQKHRVSENTLLMLMCTTLNFQQHSWRPTGKMSLVLSLPASKPSLSPRLSPPVSLSLSPTSFCLLWFSLWKKVPSLWFGGWERFNTDWKIKRQR